MRGDVQALVQETRRRAPPRRRVIACPVCGEPGPELLRRPQDVARDLDEATFQLDLPLHHEAVAVFACGECRSLFRDPDGPPFDVVDGYRRNGWSPAELDRLRVRGLADLRNDRRWLQGHGVRPGSRILEIGSYAGAFLEFAREIGADAVGVDVNPAVCGYCRRRGLDVREEPCCAEQLQEAFDAVVILNCFEQLPDPETVLREVGLVLRPGGTLLIRTPSAEFVRLAHESRLAGVLRTIADANGVLGVPFERVFAAPALVRLLRGHGYRVQRMRGREYSSLVPMGRSPAWALHRPARLALYAVASAPTRRRLYPWLDVVATLDG